MMTPRYFTWYNGVLLTVIGCSLSDHIRLMGTAIVFSGLTFRIQVQYQSTASLICWAPADFTFLLAVKYIVQSTNRDTFKSAVIGMSLVNALIFVGERHDTCGTPATAGHNVDFCFLLNKTFSIVQYHIQSRTPFLYREKQPPSVFVGQNLH